MSCGEKTRGRPVFYERGGHLKARSSECHCDEVVFNEMATSKQRAPNWRITDNTASKYSSQFDWHQRTTQTSPTKSKTHRKENSGPQAWEWKACFVSIAVHTTVTDVAHCSYRGCGIATCTRPQQRFVLLLHGSALLNSKREFILQIKSCWSMLIFPDPKTLSFSKNLWGITCQKWHRDWVFNPLGLP